MSAIANFGLYYIDSSDLIKVKGVIEYPYIKYSRLRSYTTLQLAAKTRETITLELKFTEDIDQKVSDLEFLAGTKAKQRFNVGGKNWGKYQISKVNKRIQEDNRQEVSIELEQTEQVTVVGDFSPQTDVIGSFGLFDIKREELLTPISWGLTYPTLELERLQNFPKIQDAGDQLIDLQLQLRFDKNYNSNPILRLDTLRALADYYVFYNLTILGVNYGDYVLRSLNWEYNLTDQYGNATQLDVDVALLQSPTGLPPRLPVITFFYINGVDQALALEGAINSITFEDSIDSNSLLEIEFDASVVGIPQEGDTVRIVWKYSGDTVSLDTGVLKCDRPLRRYSPDTITIGAQSLNWATGIDSKKNVKYTNTALNAIVADIASMFSLTLTSNAPSNVIPGVSPTTTGSVVFEVETCFDALTQLGRDYGYSVRLRFDKLFFQSIASLEANSFSFGLTPTDCLSAEFIQKTRGTFSQAIFPYKGTNTAATVLDSNSPTGAMLDFRTGNQFWNDLTTATARSSGELKFYNSQRHTGTIRIEGRYNAIAANNVALITFDNPNDNGLFMILKATHTLSATGGWVATLEVRKVF